MALQDYTSVQYGTSDQHKEQRAARQARDTDDTHKLIGYLSSKNPFGNDQTLQSIDTGIAAGDSVNADQAASVGRKILDGMVLKFISTWETQYQIVSFPIFLPWCNSIWIMAKLYFRSGGTSKGIEKHYGYNFY